MLFNFIGKLICKSGECEDILFADNYPFYITVMDNNLNTYMMLKGGSKKEYKDLEIEKIYDITFFFEETAIADNENLKKYHLIAKHIEKIENLKR